MAWMRKQLFDALFPIKVRNSGSADADHLFVPI